MTRLRKRRPTFSGPRDQVLEEVDTIQDGLMSGRLNQRRGTRHTPSSFVERWMRRSSAAGRDERPLLGQGDRAIASDALLSEMDDDDFGVGIPIESFPLQETSSRSDSLSLKSKPSTRRSSVDSSIDDVCMPLDDEEKEACATALVWPDTAVLEEFAKKELEDLANAEAAALVSESVNEAAEAATGGRLRPQRFAPWDRTKVLRTQSNMRFTYFRDDLPETVHSPSIAGLLHTDQRFADLFPRPSRDGPAASVSDSVIQGAAQSTMCAAAQTSPAMPASGTAETMQDGELPIPRASPVPVSVNNSYAAANASSSSLGRAPSLSGYRSHLSSPVPSIDPGPKEAFPDIQPDPAVMVKLKPPSVHHYATAASTELGSDEMGPWWLDVNSPSEDEMRILARAFGIHPLTTEDILLHEKHEKVELFHNYYFVCFNSFDVKAWESNLSSKNEGGIDDEANTAGGGNEARKCRGSIGQWSHNSSKQHRRRRKRVERLKPSPIFCIVFKTGIITVHYKPTPHTINVRRRIRLLRDYLNVSSDWVSYALIDDITDGYGPLINAVDEDVQAIDDAIMRMHSSHSDSDDESDDELNNKSVITSTTGTSSTGYREWREKGNMLRWIGEARKRVMSLLSLLSNKAGVIKGFSKRAGDHWGGAPRSEIAMYLSDIQDHLVTMTQSLNHYEKQLARSHSNYLAQINIDMTRTNNEMNDVLSKISVLGTIVLPMNIVTGLWGMNVLVPGQGSEDSLAWFYGILVAMLLFGISAYFLIVRFV